MATVHLIWWGRFKDVDTCVATANAVAQEAMGHTVQLWIRGEETAQFRKAGIHSRLKLIGVRTFLQLAQSRQDATRDPLFKQAVEVLQVLDRHQCYAAVKDLMNLILLYVHGGLCMDTTTQLLGLNEVSTHRGTRLKSALDHIGTGFKIPHISTEEWMHQPLLMTDINILQGRNYEFDGAMESLVSVPAVDVGSVCITGARDHQDGPGELCISANRVGINRAGFAYNGPSDLLRETGDSLGMTLLKIPNIEENAINSSET